MSKRDWFFTVIILLLISYILWLRQPRKEFVNVESAQVAGAVQKSPTPSPMATTTPTINPTNAQVTLAPSTAHGSSAPVYSFQEKKKTNPSFVKYQVSEDGLAVVDGDIVLGEAGPGQTGSGTASPANLQLWPNGKIPFFIQGDLKNPARVIQAISYFVDSGLQLVPHQGEEDVLVFQAAESGCRSYLGKVGGKQPVWIGPNCGATEIAHEIMHAVGFIHEQNRSDRDRYVQVIWDNIMDSAKGNFELFPEDLMKVSGTSGFDYESIMIYQPTAFTKNNQATLLPTQEGAVISPSRNLSPSDVARIKRAYRLR